MECLSRKVSLYGLCLLLVALLAPARARAAWTQAQVAGYSARIERAWVPLTDVATGTVGERVAPGAHATPGRNYGTFMLAGAQLRTARATGDGALAQAAGAIVAGILAQHAGGAPNDPFNQLAAATLLTDGRAGKLPADAWAGLREPLEAMIGRIGPFTGHGFADPSVYDNWRLVWAAAAVQIAAAGLSADPAALRAEVARIVNELAPANGGPLIRTPYGPGKALSDPPDQPLAYHLLSAVLLERIRAADPSVFGPEAAQLRERVGNYALTLMAPDGDLTLAGRSNQQSWVLAAAADLGALRASEGGPQAGAWRAFAERALDRLVRVHGTFADGTLPVVPGLRLQGDPAITDAYSSLSQYNGLTLFLLNHAAEHWPEAVPAGALPGDGDLLASDLAPGGPSLVWGRAGGVWWAIQGRQTGEDSRTTQGVVALKTRTRSGRWRDRLATRPIRVRPKTNWVLHTRRGDAHLALTRASGRGAHAVLKGRWVLSGGRTYRSARWDVRAARGHLTVVTEPLRKGERLQAGLWAPGGVTARSSRAGACTVSASGRACARRLQWRGGKRARLTL